MGQNFKQPIGTSQQSLEKLQKLIYVREALRNSQMFPDLKKDGKRPVPNDGTESAPGRGCSRTFKTLLFPVFCRKYPVSEKWHLGTQTSSILNLLIWCLLCFFNPTVQKRKKKHFILKYPLVLLTWTHLQILISQKL